MAAKQVQLTGKAIQEAREMLHWSLSDLARRSGLTTSTLRMLEASHDQPVMIPSLAAKAEKALNFAGIEFTTLDDGHLQPRLTERVRAFAPRSQSSGSYRGSGW